MPKEHLFSVTAADCKFDYIRGSGKGGQKRNKTSSAVRCHHIASGAIGYSEETRSQHTNKQAAFKKMTETKEFQTWLKLEISRKTGQLIEIEEAVDRKMSEPVREEVFVDGKWQELETNEEGGI